MVNVDSVYSAVRAIANKTERGFSPSDFNLYAPLASIDLFNKYKASYPKNTHLSEKLNHLVVSDDELTIALGKAELPADCAYIDTVSCNTSPVVERVENYAWGSRIKSVAFGPTDEYPIYRELSDQIEYLPATLSQVKLTYIKRPQTPKWAYTLVNGKPTYDSVNSKDFEWSEDERVPLISRILKYIGIEIRDTELVQIAEQEKQIAS